MKRFSKLKSKKGFTLLETLLATAILVIVGSMLMEGFITAMGFSYNSSVYSRSAAYNSHLCISKLSEWSMYADNIAGLDNSDPTDIKTIKKVAAYADVGEYDWDEGGFTTPRKIAFDGANVTVSGVTYSFTDLKVAVYEKKKVNNSASNLNSFKSVESIEGNDAAYADNRAILFYIPAYMGTHGDAKSFGNTHVYVKDDGTYVWGYDDSSATNGVHEGPAR